MSTASDKAAAFLNASAPSTTSAQRPGTGDYARLTELVSAGDLTPEEDEEFEALSEKYRKGTLEGRPKRTVTKRQSIAGEQSEGRPAKAPSASQVAASFLTGR